MRFGLRFGHDVSEKIRPDRSAGVQSHSHKRREYRCSNNTVRLEMIMNTLQPADILENSLFGGVIHQVSMFFRADFRQCHVLVRRQMTAADQADAVTFLQQRLCELPGAFAGCQSAAVVFCW